MMSGCCTRPVGRCATMTHRPWGRPPIAACGISAAVSVEARSGIGLAAPWRKSTGISGGTAGRPRTSVPASECSAIDAIVAVNGWTAMSIFGIGSVRQEKRLDLIVTLKDWQELEEVDRIGLDQEYYEILDILIPHVTIPVRTGRDLARLVEVAALDQKLKSMGQNSAVEFNQRLLNFMQKKKEQ